MVNDANITDETVRNTADVYHLPRADDNRMMA
jgi:hypothetical protein